MCRARVLLEVATHPLLVGHLQIPLLDALQQALDAHRYALQLDQDNPDTLFNTAQVLTAIAETYARDHARSDQDALKVLEEALQLQDRCLSIQELKLEDSLQQRSDAAAQAASTDLDADSPDPEVSESGEIAGNDTTDAGNQWFSIVEPVTEDTLIDTILAELGTLTTLCSILSSATAVPNHPSSLAWVEEFSSKLIKINLPPLLRNAEADRKQETALATANLVSALLEAGYRSGSIDSTTYNKERDEAFRAPELDLDRHFAALLANATSLVAFNAALADSDPATAAAQAPCRWNALSAAVANMATASKLPDLVPDDIAETHFVRGNCSLLQFQLASSPASYHQAVANSAQLLKNSGVFFSNAGKLYQEDERKAVAIFRASVAQALLAGNDLSSLISAQAHRGPDWTSAQLEDMVDDGLIQS